MTTRRHSWSKKFRHQNLFTEIIQHIATNDNGSAYEDLSYHVKWNNIKHKHELFFLHSYQSVLKAYHRNHFGCIIHKEHGL